MDKYIGKMLDNRYEILEIMGIGGMAYVYKARCHLLNRLVAIKILKEEFSRDADFRRRFHAESQAVAMLSHPNIMAVYDVSRSKELEYIVMELLDGITLKQYMQRKGPLGWREGLHYVIQIIKALSHAHSRGIIHRDIKPHNIMLLRDGSVKVADFGIARFASKQNTLTQEALGSVHYISPEQARGSHIDARSDIYSVGVVLYEMLTERLPFEGDSPVSVALQHISSLPLAPREINPDIPQALEMIVLKSMAPKLSKRYSSADDMLKDLEEFRKNPSVSFEYDLAELQTAADEGAEEPTRSLPGGGVKGTGLKLDAKSEAEERKRIRKEMRDEENHNTRKSSNLIATLSAVLGVLVVIAILGFVIVNMVGNFIGQDDDVMVDVPNLRNKALPSLEALQTEYPQLRFKVEREYNEDYDANMIFDQIPLPGIRQVKEGTEIILKVSTGRVPVLLPDFAGMDLQNVQRWLYENDLRYDASQNTAEPHDTIGRNFVIRSDPGPDTTVYKGDLIRLVYSQGKDPQQVSMPDLKGKSEQEAREMLLWHNLLIGNVTYEENDLAEGLVVSQSVKPGDKILENEIIDFVVSTGPAYVETTPSAPDIEVSPSSEPSIEPSPSEEPPPSPSPSADELVQFNQNIGIPAGIVGTTHLVVKRNDVTFFEETINTENGSPSITIRGYHSDIITVYFDDQLYYSLSIAALMQSP
ncbi:MAG: Stk1 family PASTA domain-containing Ser/Thr kinase [Oscillospiraceae bacterium]|nr:Stk1 family PASTA domain-containing Ser/Thr kinase [Oscillospiraceae bacterium]